jgi:chemotaxis response regulator CheB
VVFGLPKAAIERGHAMRIVDLKQMSSTLRAICSERIDSERAMRAAND